MKYSDRVFIVTGGASGLGAGVARMLIAKGGTVLLADLNQEAGDAYAKELGVQAHFIQCDVTDEVSALQVITRATEIGVLFGLINCAGIALAERVVAKDGAHQLENFTKVIKVNLIGSFNMLRLAAEVMAHHASTIDGERGVIINTASVAAFEGQLGQAAYAASKGGVVSMTLPIARELARFGIRVMTIAPGIMATPMLLGMPPAIQDSLNCSIPFPARMGTGEEYAALVCHIIDNSYLNGEVIRLDGAIRMGIK